MWYETYASEQGFIPGFHDQDWEAGPPWDWFDEQEEAFEQEYLGVLR